MRTGYLGGLIFVGMATVWAGCVTGADDSAGAGTAAGSGGTGSGATGSGGAGVGGSIGATGGNGGTGAAFGTGGGGGSTSTGGSGVAMGAGGAGGGAWGTGGSAGSGAWGAAGGGGLPEPGTGGAGGAAGGAGLAGAGGAAGAAGQGDAGIDAGEDAAPPDLCAPLDRTEDTVLYLSSDDSNSMASPVILRQLIRQGTNWSGYRGLIRPYEFLNYYNVGYAPAAAGSLAVTTEATAAAAAGQYNLTLGVASPAAPATRRPMNLTFVLDTSGSMSGEPIELLRNTVLRVASQLRQGDRVSMVTWNTAQQVLLDKHTATGPSDPTIVSLARRVSASGGTDLAGGLRRGYELATALFDSTRLNRVMLISDGVANVGITDENVIGQGAALNDGDGIYLVGVGVGEGINDTLMNTVTDRGRGAYVYLDEAREIDRMFGPRFDEVMDVAARAVQVELTLPWYLRMARFYGEEYSTNPRVIEPQHLAPDDAMVFHQVVAACSPAEVVPSDPVSVTVRWSTPTSHDFRTTTASTTLAELLAATPVHQPKAMAIVAYAEALRAVSGPDLDAAIALIDAADPDGNDPELVEIRALAVTARSRLP